MVIFDLIQVFDRLRSEKWDFMNNIKIIEGNLENSTLSLSSTDRKWLIENVNFIFHCAATIRFNEPLETATKVNIQGTEHLLKLAAEITNLKVRIIKCLIPFNIITTK